SGQVDPGATRPTGVDENRAGRFPSGRLHPGNSQRDRLSLGVGVIQGSDDVGALDLRAALGSLRPAEIRAGLPLEVLAIELLEPLRYHPCGLAARHRAGEEVSLVVGEALSGVGDPIPRGIGL